MESTKNKSIKKSLEFKNRKIRTALFTTGSGPLAKTALEVLLKHSDLRCVIISRKERSVSRWQRICEYGLWYSAQYTISRLMAFVANSTISPDVVKSYGIDLQYWELAKDERRVLELLISREVDTVFVCSFQHILNKTFINQLKCCLNIHPSALPAYRGPEPVTWGLLERSDTCGVTIHIIDDGIDTGEIIGQHIIRTPFLKNPYIVERQLAKAMSGLLSDTLTNLANGTLKTVQQPEGGFYLSSPTLANRLLRANQKS